MTKTAILVLQDTNTLSLAAAVDPLRAANRHSGRRIFDWQFVTPDTRDVTLTSGLTVPALPIHTVIECDILIVVAGFHLQDQATPQLMASLRRLANRTADILAIDGGPWILAQSGLLDGHQATTHWEDLEKFAATFDSVTTLNARYIVSGHRWTSGGAAPALDMMLHFIEANTSAHLAAQVAASFIHTSRPAPSAPQLRHPPAVPHSAITARAHRLMEAHLEHPLALPDMAHMLGLSARSLQLHFRRALGSTAKSYYLALRLTEAHRRILDTDHSLRDIALATGFSTPSAFSRAYATQFGHPPSATRQLPEIAS